MDIDVARWILEFLLRQPVDDCILNAVVRILPLANDVPSLKKAILLRKIESEIAKGSVSEIILGLLERIEQLDHEEGVTASEAMKKAYCAVAVDCSVRLLEKREDDAVKRLWEDRIGRMERWEKVGLVSDELRAWKDEFEALVRDASAWANVRLKSRGNDALGAARAYVAEAWESMGPSFLELVAVTLTDDTMREMLGLGNSRTCVQGGERAASLLDLHQDMSNGNKDMQKGDVLPRRNHAGVKRSRGSTAGTSRGVKITEVEELDRKESFNNYDCLPTPETNKVQEALRTSVSDLQAVVKDPLVDAIQLAENVITRMARENAIQQPTVEGQGRVDVGTLNPSGGKSAEAAPANEANLDNKCCTNQNNVPKPSLMERNGTARIYEWDDSFNSQSEGSSDLGSRPHLPTPATRVVSPLKRYKMPTKRRKRKKWTTLEEDTLRTGVQTYGVGNWKLILKSHPDIFEERTEVDLKDKWRNMMRY